ncbi:hypothetical protein ABT272_41940 [Streptomyces sp900105245]|uniref:Secreted protein n=1 Tax=Streptomyces sp. 900105245 TaxID=3154379 RepID=A0ABV1ULP3_9ACTN
MLLHGQLPQLLAVELLMGLTQCLTQVHQTLHFVRLLEHWKIARPRRKRRAAQPADLLGQLPIARGSRGPGTLIPDSREDARARA